MSRGEGDEVSIASLLSPPSVPPPPPPPPLVPCIQAQAPIVPKTVKTQKKKEEKKKKKKEDFHCRCAYRTQFLSPHTVIYVFYSIGLNNVLYIRHTTTHSTGVLHSWGRGQLYLADMSGGYDRPYSTQKRVMNSPDANAGKTWVCWATRVPSRNQRPRRGG